MDDLISRAYVLAEYDRQHQGPPGGARKIIEEAPAVDAAPVVHGRWIERHWSEEYDFGCTNHSSVMCSACGNEIYHGMKSHYCPNCGAKMDGEADG